MVNTQPTEKLRESWDHLFDVPEAQPLKTSVTALVHGRTVTTVQPGESEEETEEDKAQPVPLRVPSKKLPEMPKTPLFMQEEQALTGAEAGTVTHRVLAMTDLAGLRKAVDLAA